jgi:curved DNA-binding protein CbpA
MSEYNATRDYYEILQLNPNAEQLVITKVYRLLAAYYHPDNKQTGNEEKFKQVLEAYEVLSDPARRSRYNLSFQGNGRNQTQETTGRADRVGFSPELENLKARFAEKGGSSGAKNGTISERELRRYLLLALYDVRRNNPGNPQLSLLVLSELLGARIEELEFSNWYLKEKGYIKVTESADFSITIAGVDYVENELNKSDGDRQYRSLPEARF